MLKQADMRNSFTKRVLVPFFFLIICIMATNGYSQEIPANDRISTSAGDVVMTFLGHGSLMFRIGDYAVYIDPVSSYGDYKNLPRADLILVTHEHSDHLDLKLIDEIKKEGTLVFTNQKSTEKIGWAIAMRPGDRQEVNSIVIEAVHAYNIVHMRSPGQPFHPKGTGVGYVLTIGGKKFYIAGDTENIPEMKDLTGIEVAFLPMNLPYTMTPEMAADAARSFKPRILYPYHYGETDPEELVLLLKGSGIEVRIRNLQ
jgi:L-ascorbate metabolism protein UlaG (beta-lactamase superfamily)